MELNQFNDKQKALMSAEDRKQFGREAETYNEAESRACVKAHRELQRMIKSWCDRYKLKYILAPTRNKSYLPVGWPDITIFGPNGLTLFCEIKVGKDVLSHEQRDTIAKLRELGHTVLVVGSYEYATRFAYAFFYHGNLL